MTQRTNIAIVGMGFDGSYQGKTIGFALTVNGKSRKRSEILDEKFGEISELIKENARFL